MPTASTTRRDDTAPTTPDSGASHADPLAGTQLGDSLQDPLAGGTQTRGAPGDGGPGIPPGFDPDAKAKALHEAFDGWGTDERAVLDTLYTGRADLTKMVESAYNRRYNPSLKQSLRDELSGADLAKALKLLRAGGLTLADKIREAARGWGTDETKIFNALERASAAELKTVRDDPKVVELLRGELSGDDWKLAESFLQGRGQLAAKLRRAVGGWGTDEEAIWRALEGASAEERQFVLDQPALMSHLRSDLDASDYERARRMLTGTMDNVDRLAIAMAGWGTDEDGVAGALAVLTSAEFARLPADIDDQLESELGGSDLALAQEALHQKRLAFDAEYRKSYVEAQQAKLGEGGLKHEGSSALLAGEGQAHSPVAKLLAACKGAGTDDSTVWTVLAALKPAEREFIRTYNPDGVLDALRDDLSSGDYRRATQALGGPATAAMAAMREAVDGWGTDERLLYDAVDRAAREGVGAEVLADNEIVAAVHGDVSSTQFDVFVAVMRSGRFTPRQRLVWATAGAGTDEDTVFELCEQYGREWWDGSAIAADVDAILQGELDTRDYWRAKDLIRGEPRSEQERLDRAKEALERERSSGLSNAIMDTFSHSGENADDAWREYQASFNVAHADGQLSQDEVAGLRRDEQFSQRMTAEYRATKASVAQWATQIAVAIVGIAATILTAGAAGPFVAGLAAALGGKVAVVAEAMVMAAALKVGLNKAIQGEGYDLTSTQTLVDACSASVEVGMNMLGGQLATKVMSGLGKTAFVRSVGPAVRKVFGDAGTRILGAGFDGMIDGAIGGIGEGAFLAMANENTWKGDSEDIFGKLGQSIGVNTAMSAVGGFIGGAGFQSIGEVFGPRLRARMGDDPAKHAVPEGDDLAKKARVQQDEELPGLRPEHESSATYKDYDLGKAFLQGQGDAAGEVSPYAVKQGALGDCYFCAGMAATARADPHAIKRIIKDNGDGTFEVTLFIRENSWSQPRAVTKTVDARLPTKGGKPLYAKIGASTQEGDELWPALLEKTLAQHKGSYDQISGGKIADGFEFHGATELLTGKSERYFRTSSLSDDQTLQMINEALTKGRPITVDSKSADLMGDLVKEAEKVDVYANHAYAIESVDVDKGLIKLQNPWGSNHPPPLPIKNFKQYYQALRVGGN